jgi:hypothetical protein
MRKNWSQLELAKSKESPLIFVLLHFTLVFYLKLNPLTQITNKMIMLMMLNSPC